MKKESKIAQRFLRPRGWLLALLYVLTAAAVVASIVLVVLGGERQILGTIAYVLFGIAAVLLAYTVYTIVIYVPLVKQKIVERLKRRKFTAGIVENYGFKTVVFSLVSFGITVAFAVMNAVRAFRYRLLWYVAIALYYTVLIVFRGGLLLADKQCKKKLGADSAAYERSKLQIYLACGAVLILLEFAMAGAVTQMMLSEKPMQSGMVMAISNAAYTFCKMTMAIYNLFKARKYDDPVIRALRNVNFADACMSTVSLTVLMLATFGESGEPAYMKAGVGVAACAAIIIMASVMIVGASKKLKIRTGGTENERE